MTFTEATLSGRDFRHPDMGEGMYYGFNNGEELTFVYSGGKRPPYLNMHALTRTDYEFVEDEVIEVGYSCPHCGRGININIVE